MAERVMVTFLVLAAASIYGAAFAVSPAVVTGDGTTETDGARSERLDELLWEQWDPLGENVVLGSMYYVTQDMKVADNYQVTASGYLFSCWESYICYWYGSPDTSKGVWVCIYEDGGSTPATTEPYEFGSNPGWHADLEAGNGGEGYGGIAGLVGADYWTYGNMTEDYTGMLWGYYPYYFLSADFGDSESGGWLSITDADNVYWLAYQRLGNADTGPYGGPPDVSDTLSPYWVQQGVDGPAWEYPDYPYGMPLRLYGEVEESDPEITNMYPQDADYPSGVPVGTWAGCHWTQSDPDGLAIKVSESNFYLYDDNMDDIDGTLVIDDSDLFDVAVDFEPDDLLNGGETYNVETTCYDLAGNSDTETWQFTTGYANIAPESLGGIKARFAE